MGNFNSYLAPYSIVSESSFTSSVNKNAFVSPTQKRTRIRLPKLTLCRLFLVYLFIAKLALSYVSMVRQTGRFDQFLLMIAVLISDHGYSSLGSHTFSISTGFVRTINQLFGQAAIRPIRQHDHGFCKYPTDWDFGKTLNLPPIYVSPNRCLYHCFQVQLAVDISRKLNFTFRACGLRNHPPHLDEAAEERGSC